MNKKSTLAAADKKDLNDFLDNATTIKNNKDIHNIYKNLINNEPLKNFITDIMNQDTNTINQLQEYFKKIKRSKKK